MLKPFRPFDRLPQFDFMRQRMFWLWGSLAMTVLTLVLMGMNGLNYGIDFVGGKLVQVQTVQLANVAEVRKATEDVGFTGVTIQQYGSDREFLIRLPGNDPRVAPAGAEAAIVGQLNSSVGGAELRRVEFVGPQVGQELKVKGLLAMIVATMAILFYVWVRFEFVYGMGAILALVHDVILTIGVMSLLKTEVTLTVLAAILTLIGYSLNDTIVIFDRIRENRAKYPNRPLRELINLSVNQTMARTIMTVSTVMVVLLALLFFGGEVLYDFSFVLVIGTLFGTYSSIFVATAALLMLDERQKKKAKAGN